MLDKPPQFSRSKITLFVTMVWSLLITTLFMQTALAQPVSQPLSQQLLPDNQIVKELNARLDKLTAEDRFSGMALLAKDNTILF